MLASDFLAEVFGLAGVALTVFLGLGFEFAFTAGLVCLTLVAAAFGGSGVSGASGDSVSFGGVSGSLGSGRSVSLCLLGTSSSEESFNF